MQKETWIREQVKVAISWQIVGMFYFENEWKRKYVKIRQKWKHKSHVYNLLIKTFIFCMYPHFLNYG